MIFYVLIEQPTSSVMFIIPKMQQYIHYISLSWFAAVSHMVIRRQTSFDPELITRMEVTFDYVKRSQFKILRQKGHNRRNFWNQSSICCLNCLRGVDYSDDFLTYLEELGASPSVRWEESSWIRDFIVSFSCK